MRVLYPGRNGIWIVGFCGGRKTGEPEENRRRKVRTYNKLNPRVAPGRNRTRATLVGGERSHHRGIPTLRVVVGHKNFFFSFFPLSVPCTVYFFTSELLSNLSLNTTIRKVDVASGNGLWCHKYQMKVRFTCMVRHTLYYDCPAQLTQDCVCPDSNLSLV